MSLSPAKSTLTRRLIAQAALDVIDSEGLGELSLQRVATQLGIKAPSLYHHFKDKDELLTVVARLILLDTPVVPEPRAGQWRRWLLRQCVGFRKAILRHPNAAPLLLGYIPRELFAAQYERSSRILLREGVPLYLHVLIFEAIDKLTLGSAIFAATTSDDTVFFPTLDPDETPTLCEVVDSNNWSTEQVFEKAIQSFLESIPSISDAKPSPVFGVSGS